MRIPILVSAIAIASCIGGTAVVSADDFPFQKEVEARQAVMKVYTYNIGLLGAMAKGDKEYDAELAATLASNLLAAVNMKNSTMWPQGSDADAEGLAGNTRAKSENWSDYPKASEAGKALADAATELAAVAGDGLDALKSAIGPAGKSCKGCHDDFRVPKD